MAIQRTPGGIQRGRGKSVKVPLAREKKVGKVKYIRRGRKLQTKER